MGNSNKIQPIDQKIDLIDRTISNESKINESGKKRKQLSDPFYTEEKYNNTGIIVNWILTSEHKEFYMVFKLDNGNSIYLIRENVVNNTKPIRNNKLVLSTPNNKFTFHMSEMFNHIYDFCLHKITEIICYNDKNMKTRLWESKYKKDELIVLLANDE